MKTDTFTAPTSDRSVSGQIHYLPISHILVNPNQPRRSFPADSLRRLTDSIRRYGILQPLTVRRIQAKEEEPKETRLTSQNGGEIALYFGSHKYELICGERRLRAAKDAGMNEVPCVVLICDDCSSAEMAIIENIQREDLNMFEQASAISSLIDIYGMTQEQIASVLSMSQSYVANKLRILRLTEAERNIVLENGLTERHVRALLRLTDTDRRTDAMQYVISHELNVAKTDRYIERILQGTEAEKERRNRRFREIVILKDVRIFSNTLDRAIATMEKAGIPVKTEKHESDDATEWTIRVPKRKESV